MKTKGRESEMPKQAKPKGLRMWIGGQGDATWSMWLAKPTCYGDDGIWYGTSRHEGPTFDLETGDGPKAMKRLARLSGVKLPAPGELIEAVLLLSPKGA